MTDKCGAEIPTPIEQKNGKVYLTAFSFFVEFLHVVN
jgi:hypothetical protein